MAIDYGRLRSLTAREMISALMRDGFAFDEAMHKMIAEADRITSIATGTVAALP